MNHYARIHVLYLYLTCLPIYQPASKPNPEPDYRQVPPSL
jgi:hypothetical protein